MVSRNNGFSDSERRKIKKYLDRGLSGTEISRRLGRRKSTVLSQIRRIKGSPKQKSKITVKGWNSQTILRKKAQKRRLDESVKRTKDYNHPKVRYYAIISTERKFAYPLSSQKKVNILQKGLTSEDDIDELDQLLFELYEEGYEPQVRFVDVKTSRVVKRQTIKRRVNVEKVPQA